MDKMQSRYSDEPLDLDSQSTSSSLIQKAKDIMLNITLKALNEALKKGMTEWILEKDFILSRQKCTSVSMNKNDLNHVIY